MVHDVTNGNLRPSISPVELDRVTGGYQMPAVPPDNMKDFVAAIQKGCESKGLGFKVLEHRWTNFEPDGTQVGESTQPKPTLGECFERGRKGS